MANLGRTQRALAQARKRLHAVNDRLGAEIEQHQALQQSLEHARYHDPLPACRIAATSWINSIVPCASCALGAGSALSLSYRH